MERMALSARPVNKASILTLTKTVRAVIKTARPASMNLLTVLLVRITLSSKDRNVKIALEDAKSVPMKEVVLSARKGSS